MKHVHSGKVRDLYKLDNGDLVLVASDRVSVYDVRLPTAVPDKGALLTALSSWWFDQVADIVPNHVISTTDVPAQFAGRAVRCRPLTMIGVECIARGYLAGLGLQEYKKTGAICGVELPPGLVEGSKLPEPIFTPTTKATVGHDEFITFDVVVNEVGRETAERLRDLTLAVYRRGADMALERGVIIADTKLEFGWDDNDVLTLGDEVLTSDSSRFWRVDEWQPGRDGGQRAYDKQFVRDWSVSSGWDKTPPGPEMPAEVVEATRQRYTEVYERITGLTWSSPETAASTTANNEYDPVHLTHEVFRLLLDQGLPVERTGDFNRAVDGAGNILRWLGMEPVIPADVASYRHLDLDGHRSYNRRVHGD